MEFLPTSQQRALKEFHVRELSSGHIVCYSERPQGIKILHEHNSWHEQRERMYSSLPNDIGGESKRAVSKWVLPKIAPGGASMELLI